jgi:hypothetical protein
MNTVLSDGEITGTIAEIVRTPFPPMYFDENMVAIHKVVEKQDAFTRLELAKAVRKIDTKRVSCYGYIEEITCTELKETVLKLLEGK